MATPTDASSLISDARAGGPEPKKRWFEPATVILMALTTILTTWCSYESSRWTGQSSGFQNQTNEIQRNALAMRLESNQVEALQASMFMQMINAKLAGNDKLAEFYIARFSGELKPAYEKWIALKPFDNLAAPPHPFIPELYVPHFKTEIQHLGDDAARAQTRASTSSKNAAGYLSNTVLLAAVLFFAGTASKFDQRRVRLGSLLFATVFFLYAAVRMLLLPVA